MSIGELLRNESYQSILSDLPSSQAKVYQAVAERGERGATREEIAQLTGMKLSSVCGRVKELLDSAELNESPTPRTGSSGKPNSVLVVNAEHGPTDKHVDALRDYMTSRGYEPTWPLCLVADIMLHYRTSGLWPRGSERQWLAALELGLARGLFVMESPNRTGQGNVKLAPMPAEESQGAVKQLDLF